MTHLPFFGCCFSWVTFFSVNELSALIGCGMTLSTATGGTQHTPSSPWEPLSEERVFTIRERHKFGPLLHSLPRFRLRPLCFETWSRRRGGGTLSPRFFCRHLFTEDQIYVNRCSVTACASSSDISSSWWYEGDLAIMSACQAWIYTFRPSKLAWF